MGFGIAIDDVGTRHSNLETVMSLRPHFIKISDVLVRGIARSHRQARDAALAAPHRRHRSTP